MKRTFAMARLGAWVGTIALTSGCSTHHWAPVETSKLPPPPGEKVLHTDRLVVQITNGSQENQCVVYKDNHPICFYNVDNALESGLLRSLWPAFPEVVLGSKKNVGPSDYFLQVEVTLDALPPDESGPGWSAGARSRYRLLRAGKVISEQTMASRSRPHFAYGAPLGEGATEVIDATIVHLAQMVSEVPESRPDAPVPLPAVAARVVVDSKQEPGARKAPPTNAVAEAQPAKAKSVETEEPAQSSQQAKTEEPAPPPPQE